ncbi:MAG: type II toxin-antitoxin system VapC family toxin [Acidobacteriota bacterium]|nr:type II toxin-antitoxin system VapC family toxin [Acidobacteriota bacterium]
MHLLDTETLTHLHAGHPRVVARLQALADPNVGTTIITRIEMLRGRMDHVFKAATSDDLLRAQFLLARTEELLEQILIVPFDSAAAAQFDQLRTIRSLRKIGRGDILITAIALANRATLVTRNLRHFKQFPGLKLENWVD